MDLTSFLASLSDSGIDIVQPFDARWYDALIEQEGLTKQLKPLPKMGSRDGALGFLLGNSRALWPAFLKWLSDQPDAEAIADPLDKYIASVIQPAVRLLTGKEMRHELIWPWESGDRLVSMQRVAVCSGLCYHDGETQLAIHPKFGAWIAFRAVLILDAAPSVCGLPSKAPEPVPCLMTSDEKEAARAAMAAALRASDEANLCTQLHGANGMKTDVRLAWAALRDCVRVGRQYRYSEAQLVYHYTKDRQLLLDAMRGVTAVSNRGRRPWLASLLEVLATFLLPLALILLAIYTSGKKGMPGKPGDDLRLHRLAK